MFQCLSSVAVMTPSITFAKLLVAEIMRSDLICYDLDVASLAC